MEQSVIIDISNGFNGGGSGGIDISGSGKIFLSIEGKLDLEPIIQEKKLIFKVQI